MLKCITVSQSQMLSRGMYWHAMTIRIHHTLSLRYNVRIDPKASDLLTVVCLRKP